MLRHFQTFVSALGIRRILFLLVVLLTCLTFEGLKIVQAAREAARRVECRRNMGGDREAESTTYHEMAARFPIVPLGNRLSYKQGGRPPDGSDSDPVLSTDAEQLLEEFEDKAIWNSRRWTLEKLHDVNYAEFVERNGFGNGRMRRPLDWETILVPEPQLVSLPVPPHSRHSADGDPSETPSSLNVLSTIELSNLHHDGYFDFANPTRLGVVVTPDQMTSNQVSISSVVLPRTARMGTDFPVDVSWRPLSVGFVSHAMADDLNRKMQDRLAEWQISKLELVSLLKFQTPRVYVSRDLPNMEQLRNAVTRATEEFEDRALQQLEVGEDLVVIQQINHIRMVGAVRAAKQCLSCHSVRRGTLLGAFSYSLHRKQPIVVPNGKRNSVSIWQNRNLLTM